MSSANAYFGWQIDYTDLRSFLKAHNAHTCSDEEDGFCTCGADCWFPGGDHNLQKIAIRYLRKVCQIFGTPMGGDRADLIRRLSEYDKEKVQDVLRKVAGPVSPIPKEIEIVDSMLEYDQELPTRSYYIALMSVDGATRDGFDKMITTELLEQGRKLFLQIDGHSERPTCDACCELRVEQKKLHTDFPEPKFFSTLYID